MCKERQGPSFIRMCALASLGKYIDKGSTGRRMQSMCALRALGAGEVHLGIMHRA